MSSVDIQVKLTLQCMSTLVQGEKKTPPKPLPKIHLCEAAVSAFDFRLH